MAVFLLSLDQFDQSGYARLGDQRDVLSDMGDASVIGIIKSCNPVAVPPAAAVQNPGNVFREFTVDTEKAVDFRVTVEIFCQKCLFFGGVRDGQGNQTLMFRRQK